MSGEYGYQRIKRISQEKAKRNEKKFNKSFSLKVAKKKAKRKQVYRLPSGLYLWRKSKRRKK